MSEIEKIMTPTSLILNGYFYTFGYKPASTGLKFPIDSNPIIYCIAPSEVNKNNFIALNFNHLPKAKAVELITKMNNKKKVFSVRAIFTETELNSLVPGALIAIREYNRTRIYNPQQFLGSGIISYLYDRYGMNSPDSKKDQSIVNFYINNTEADSEE